MSYAIPQDLSDRLGSVTYAAIYANDTTLAEAHISAASAEVESYVALRYKMPPVTAKTQNLVKHYSLTLAEELAWGVSGAQAIPESVKSRAASVRKILEMIARGEASFADGETLESSAGSSAFIAAETPLMTRKTMAGY